MTPRELRWEKLLHSKAMPEEELRVVLRAMKTMPPIGLLNPEVHGRSGGSALAISQRVRNIDTFKALQQLHRAGKVYRFEGSKHTVYYI